jgi:predicted nucleotidyltransferase
VTALPELLDTLRDQSAPDSQLRRIEALHGLARQEPGLRALFLVGSFAKGTGNRISDLDLVALVDDGQQQRILDLAEPHLGAATLQLDRFTGRHREIGAFRKYVYLDFSSVELHAFGISAGFRLYRPYLTIWDPEKLAAACAADGEALRHEDFEPYEYGDAGLIWELVDCIKWLARGRAELAKRYLVRLGRKIDEGSSAPR